MNLRCRVELAAAYKAGSQIARVLSEDWCGRELYCPACDSKRLLRSRTNTPAIDFTCPECEQSFQLKSLRTWNPNKVVDAGYDAMIRAIRSDKASHLLVLQYTNEWRVANVLLVPRMFFTESTIERRNPLGAAARRAGWVGCNIFLGGIPADGKIALVSNGVPEPKRRVRKEFDRVRRLAEVPPMLRRWTVDVLNGIRRLGKRRFSLQELYRLETELELLHPHNLNIRPKIRQQLQVLRDLRLIGFEGQGRYRLEG
ncbi:MAG: DpnI domain-containing protein [Terriglobales bacterium]